MVQGRKCLIVLSWAREPVIAMLRRRRWCLVIMLASWSTPTGTAQALRWRLQPLPRPVNILSAVSCTSATACTVVGAGAGIPPVGLTPPVLRLDGTVWSIQKTAKPVGTGGWTFNGVSCPSLRVCFAVGALRTKSDTTAALAERWNGSSWHVQPIPTPGGQSEPSVLNAVSCTSARACTAVGGYGKDPVLLGVMLSLIERWNGSRWSIQPAPMAGRDLYGVSCTSRRSCSAVGNDVTPPGVLSSIALRWAGKRWSGSQAPGWFSGALGAVSCTSAMVCTAVGGFAGLSGGGETPIAGQWNGTRWRGPQHPGSGILNDVSCTSASACTAVSDLGSAVEWNGAHWSEQLALASADLLGVSCVSETVCVAVGISNAGGVVERRS